MSKKYRVTLSKEERTTFLDLISKGKASAKKLTHARIPRLPVELRETLMIY